MPHYCLDNFYGSFGELFHLYDGIYCEEDGSEGQFLLVIIIEEYRGENNATVTCGEDCSNKYELPAVVVVADEAIPLLTHADGIPPKLRDDDANSRPLPDSLPREMLPSAKATAQKLCTLEYKKGGGGKRYAVVYEIEKKDTGVKFCVGFQVNPTYPKLKHSRHVMIKKTSDLCDYVHEQTFDKRVFLFHKR